MEIGELFWGHIDSESLEPTPLGVVSVHIDQKGEVVERTCGGSDFGMPVE
jgi:hypothetical protein